MDDPEAMTDAELREKLREIDESDHDVTKWEAEFLQSVVYAYGGSLSEKQRSAAIKIIGKYN
jgi:hypothetical protein